MTCRSGLLHAETAQHDLATAGKPPRSRVACVRTWDRDSGMGRRKSMHTGCDSACGCPVPEEAARTPGTPSCGESAGALNRRSVLSATMVAGLTAASATTLAACGGSGGSPPSPGTALAHTADIPRDGGKIFPDKHVVVTQPAADQYKAFSSTCTHRGCTVGRISGGRI